MFCYIIESRLLNTTKKNNAGAKSFDVVMMFKIMILQRYYNLGDKQVEYQIVDRKFLGLETGEKFLMRKLYGRTGRGSLRPLL